MSRLKIKKKPALTPMFKIIKLQGSLKDRFCRASKEALLRDGIIYLECDRCRAVYALHDEDVMHMFCESSGVPMEARYHAPIVKFPLTKGMKAPCCSPVAFSFIAKEGGDNRQFELYKICDYEEMGIPTVAEINKGAKRRVMLFCEGCTEICSVVMEER